MTQKVIKRGWVDWAVIGVMLLIPTSLAVLSIAYPNPETKAECIRRVTKDIRDRYYNAGKLTIDTTEEIEALASEIKSKCPN
ncbi:MAG: hypothetical protein RMY64_10365 [Nostoc sp. DedQUE08]|uniref:hypothetical protein n=1 Tax=Nostoc sp. DedQUE08 TaxID=3075393 RepID=UPI002AD40320|nr:hypothetical protein [Nostoc sp. DedQUE08]MDZ8066030.1 hypothetical protein [Nostoc sp. DedQUE08]